MLHWLRKKTGRNCTPAGRENLNLLSSAGTERPVESTDTVHVLSVFGLLLLPHAVDIVPGYFRVLSRSESREAHGFLHYSLHIVRVFNIAHHISMIPILLIGDVGIGTVSCCPVRTAVVSS